MITEIYFFGSRNGHATMKSQMAFAELSGQTAVCTTGIEQQFLFALIHTT